MKILNISMHAFGKFSDKTIHFAEGLNIIRGDNEAGKSTMHQFIEVMFYGFYKPYVKKKLYEDSYEKYLPWDNNGYSGTLTIEDEGRKIRLERQLMKGKDDLSIYDVDTGEDITGQYDYNKVTKLADITRAHIGFNKVTYKNTISLTQMQSRTQEELIREIKDNMSNLASTHQSTISVDKVIERIEAKENAIGSNRKRTSLYYKLGKELGDLREALKHSKEVHLLVSNEKVKENKFIEQLGKKQEEDKYIRKQIGYLNYLEDQKLIDKAQMIEVEISHITKEIKEVEAYKDFDINVTAQLRQDKEAQNKLRSEIKEFQIREDVLNAELNSLADINNKMDDVSNVKESFETINRTIHGFESDLDTLKTKEQEMQAIKNQYDLLEEVNTPTSSRMVYVALGVIGVASIIFAILYSPIMFGFTFMLVIASRGVAYLDQQKRVNYDNFTIKKDKLEAQVSITNLSISALRSKLEAILEEEQVSDHYGLKTKRDELLKALSAIELRQTTLHENALKTTKLKQELDGIKKTITSITERLDVICNDYQRTLSKYHITSDTLIQETFEKHLRYSGLSKDVDNLKTRMSELLGPVSLEGLKRQVKETQTVTLEEGSSPSTLGDRLEAVRLEILNITEQLSEVMTKGAELERTTKTVSEIEELIVDKEKILKAYDKDLKVASMMKTAIETIATDIQNNFAPVLNEQLSEVVDHVSKNKYSDIKVNPQMELTIFDKQAHKTVKAESLSEGTIDMLYFGLRLGIAGVISEGKSLPLILDDAFVQYDNKRLASVLNLLSRGDRQVILFTCHDREVEYLSEAGESYQLIEL